MANCSNNTNAGFLLADITRRMRAQFQQRLEGTNLTLAQAKALMYLSRNQGVKQKELADTLDIAPMTLAKQLDQLADSGLIERQPDPQDRRAHRVYLTDASKPVMTMIEAESKRLRADMMQDLSEQEIEQFIRALSLIRDRLLSL